MKRIGAGDVESTRTGPWEVRGVAERNAVREVFEEGEGSSGATAVVRRHLEIVWVS